jgi:hypothetical protein
MCAACGNLFYSENPHNGAMCAERGKEAEYLRDCELWIAATIEDYENHPSSFLRPKDFDSGFKCDHCYKIYKTESAAKTHEKKCYKNKENKACASCYFFMWFRAGITDIGKLPERKNTRLTISKMIDGYLYAICTIGIGKTESETYHLVRKDCHLWAGEKVLNHSSNISWEKIKNIG